MRLRTLTVAFCAALLFNPTAFAADVAQRWVSAGGALSEWVSALGGESRLVGVDTTSQHPEALKALPSIGYQRQLSAEGILSLRPQILVGTDEMGPPPVLAQIRSAGVQVELFSAEPELPVLQANLQRLGTLLGAEAEAARLFTAYQQRLDQQAVWVREAQTRVQAPGVLVVIGNAGGKSLVAGKDTAADWVVRRAGGRNLASHTGYKPFSVESLAGLSPDVLVFSDRSLFGEAARAALFRENPIFASTPAAKAGRVFELDPTLLVGGLGPRLPQRLLTLAGEFYAQAPAAKAAP